MENKPHLSLTDQLELLHSRGLLIEDSEVASKALSAFNYYRFVEYLFAFQPKTGSKFSGTYYTGVTFNDVLELAAFDYRLRGLLFDALANFETKLRTTVAFHGGAVDPMFHVTGKGIDTKFMLFGANDVFSHFEWVKNYSIKIGNLAGEDALRNLEAENTSVIPVWGAVELMDFGTLSRLYKHTDHDLSAKISAEFKCSSSLLKNWTASLNEVRNYVAHHGRIWNRKFTYSPKTGSSLLPEPIMHLKQLPGKELSLIYARLCLLAWLTEEILPTPGFKIQLKSLMKTFPNNGFLSIDSMGFPDDWADMNIWN